MRGWANNDEHRPQHDGRKTVKRAVHGGQEFRRSRVLARSFAATPKKETQAEAEQQQQHQAQSS